MARYNKIIFVCTGNTCRSAMALGIARDETARCGLDIALDSCGTGAADGSPASDNAIAACEEVGIDISGHKSKHFEAVEYDDQTLFVALAGNHFSWLRYIGMIPRDNIILLGEGIPDPFGQPLPIYRACRDAINRGIAELFERLAPELPHKTEAPRRSMRCRIAAMTADDLDAIAELEAQCFSDAWSRTSFEEELENPAAYFITAHIDDELCGYGGILTAADIAEMPKICVSPQRRRMRIGEAMLTRLMNAAIKRGASEFTLEVRISNEAAIALYEKKGFETDGVRPGFYSSPTEDARIMTKKL